LEQNHHERWSKQGTQRKKDTISFQYNWYATE
jgi:hypothetical protein